MKNLIVVCFFLMAIASVSAKDIVVDRPPFSVRSHTSIEIDRIILSDTATILEVTGYYRPKYWIRISSETYLRAGKQKLQVRSAIGVGLDKEIYMDETGQKSFSLVFPPMDASIKQIDFIESDCEDCFKIWGIELHSKTLTNKQLVPKEALNAIKQVDNAPLKEPVLELGAATLKGKLLGFVPGMPDKISIYVNDIMIGNQREEILLIQPDGSFEKKFDLIAPMRIFINSSFNLNESILLFPNKETSMYIDLQTKDQFQSRTRIDKIEETRYVWFAGANASLNNQLTDKNSTKFVNEISSGSEVLAQVNGMSPDQYKAFFMQKLNTQLEKINANPALSPEMKTLTALGCQFRTLNYLSLIQYYLESAYKKANNIESRGTPEGYTKPVITKDYYSFYKDFPVNSMIALYSADYPYVISSCRYIATNFQEDMESSYKKNLKELIQTGNLSPEEIAVAEQVLKTPFGQPDTVQTKAKTDFFTKYNETLGQMTKRRMSEDSKALMAQILGTDKGVLFDMMAAGDFGAKLGDYQLLSEEDWRAINAMPTSYKSYLVQKNNELAAQIEENKKKSGFFKRDIPEVENEKLFSTIAEKYKGKVVLVDFWATWCGPCKSAMTSFEPHKKKLEEAGVVFVYLTDETSPAGTWNNMIANINGEHYRMKSDQFKYLRNEFKAEGVPSYLILDKEGKQVYFRVGFEGPEVITKKLTEVL